MARTRWPEGLDDKAAITRIQSFMVNVAEGQRNIAEDRQYTELRKVARNRPELRDRLPDFVVTHKSLDSFSAYIREIDSRSLRVEMVRSEFRDLLRILSQDKPASVDSSSWTGKPTVAQQAVIVRKASLEAITAIDHLLAEQDRRLSNGGPVEPEEQAAIDRLKQLRSALDILIKAVEAGQPYGAQMRRIGMLGAKSLTDFRAGLAADFASMSASFAPVTVAAFAYALCQSVGMAVEGSAMIGAAAATGPVAKRFSDHRAGVRAKSA